jgi:hypothetical protein
MRLEANVIAPDVLVPEALDPGALVNWLPRRSKPLNKKVWKKIRQPYSKPTSDGLVRDKKIGGS